MPEENEVPLWCVQQGPYSYVCCVASVKNGIIINMFRSYATNQYLQMMRQTGLVLDANNCVWTGYEFSNYVTLLVCYMILSHCVCSHIFLLVAPVVFQA